MEGDSEKPGRAASSSAGSSVENGLDEASLKQWSEADLISLAEHMQQELDVRDRIRGFRRYECCFTGKEAVKWLLDNQKASTPEEAVMLGNDMARAGLLHHVSFKRPFQNRKSFYRFLDVGEASEGDDSSSAAHSPLAPDASGASRDPFSSFERLYDGLWARRQAGHDSGSAATPGGAGSAGTGGQGTRAGGHGGGPALRGTNRGTQWSVAAELTHLQRRVADLAAELQEQQEMNKLMLDAQTLQMRNQQELFGLLQSRLERAIRRGTWLAVQLQLVFACMAFLLTFQALQYASQQPQSGWLHALEAAAPYLAASAVAGALLCQPWAIARRKEASDSDAISGSREHEPEHAAASEGAKRDEDKQEPIAELEREERSSLHRPPEHGASVVPSAEHFEGWPDAPLLVRPAPLDYQRVHSDAAGGAVCINDGGRVEFETPLFQGCAVVWVAGLPSAPKGLFEGRRRKTSITIQGRFKRELAFDDVVTGQEFARPAQNLPAKWLVETVLIRLAKRISPSMEIGPLSAPYLLVPVMAMAQVVNVSRFGEEPDPTGSVPEDVRLHDSSLADSEGHPLPATKRKKYMWSAKHRADRCFDTEHVWTFQLYQHFVDMGAYELNMIYKFDLTRNLDGQPLQFMLKDRASGQYLLNLHAWHQKLVADSDTAQVSCDVTGITAKPHEETEAESGHDG